MQQLLALYDLNKNDCVVKSFGGGLINNTWLITSGSDRFILQKINKTVFKQPQLIDENIHSINEYLTQFKPAYKLCAPLPSLTGKTLVEFENEYYRLFEFIPSDTYPVADNIEIAFEAAKKFGEFTKVLSGFNAEILNETIPHFHDLQLRYTQFLHAIKNGDEKRLNHAQGIIQSLLQYTDIVDAYNEILKNPCFKKRVTHHDTKISNVLFDDNNKAICIIDLDTVMPGYFISDVGDMMRTYLSPVSEEETNFNLIELRDDFFHAIAKGYLSEMKNEFSSAEITAFVYAGKFMIYMQALRFITDYLNNDIYYGAKYELHNFNRAQNQLRLLECLIEKEEKYNSIVQQFTINH